MLSQNPNFNIRHNEKFLCRNTQGKEMRRRCSSRVLVAVTDF